MQYKVKEKFNKKIDCILLVVCANHIVICLVSTLVVCANHIVICLVSTLV
jgi:hypothetical protein